MSWEPRDVYVARCGTACSTYAEGIRHERNCQACNAPPQVITGPGIYLTRDHRKAEVVGRAAADVPRPWLGLLLDQGMLCDWDDAGRCVGGDCQFSDDLVTRLLSVPVIR